MYAQYKFYIYYYYYYHLFFSKQAQFLHRCSVQMNCTSFYERMFLPHNTTTCSVLDKLEIKIFESYLWIEKYMYLCIPVVFA